MQTINLKPGREKSLLRRHPWIFSGALHEPREKISPGATVRVHDASGTPLALAAWSPQSQIRARVWSHDPGEVIDAGFFARRIADAMARRHAFVPATSDTYRLVNAESDGLPGVIIDRYAGFYVVQLLSAGAEFWKDAVVRQLQQQATPQGIYERSDVDVRDKEGLRPASGLLAGAEPPEHIQVLQHGRQMLVDIRHGHKTGLYLDQCWNHHLVESYADSREVLNCFAYTGAFTLAALRGGATRVANVETSDSALSLLAKNLELNGMPAERVENHQGDAFTVLRQFRDRGRQFDMVILDPPKFVSSAQQVERGSRGYKDINLLAFKLLRPGGILVTFSCSGHVSADLFQKIVADAALDAGRAAAILHFLAQAPDHPVALNFPEGRYLKGVLCTVV
jgi:23S rRNA (cytosine1962-C5)-methyltransferase